MTETAEYTIRASEPADLETISEIYRHAVETSRASFETVAPDVVEMTRRRNAILGEGLPYIVAESRGRIVGYAYAGPYRPRPAYRFTVENSVYVHRDARGSGIGKALLLRIISDCKAAGKKQMIAVIGDAENTGSINLHRSVGFEHVGILKKVGFKFDGWVDVVLMQRSLE